MKLSFVSCSSLVPGWCRYVAPSTTPDQSFPRSLSSYPQPHLIYCTTKTLTFNINIINNIENNINVQLGILKSDISFGFVSANPFFTNFRSSVAFFYHRWLTRANIQPAVCEAVRGLLILILVFTCCLLSPVSSVYERERADSSSLLILTDWSCLLLLLPTYLPTYLPDSYHLPSRAVPERKRERYTIVETLIESLWKRAHIHTHKTQVTSERRKKKFHKGINTACLSSSQSSSFCTWLSAYSVLLFVAVYSVRSLVCFLHHVPFASQSMRLACASSIHSILSTLPLIFLFIASPIRHSCC